MDADEGNEADSSFILGCLHCAPRTPNPDTTQGESSTPRKPTVIRFRLRSQPDLEKPIPTSAEIDIDSLDEATRLTIAIQ
ncbi:hypothetical protein Tco_0396175 [Tanacetum coccineum]